KRTYNTIRLPVITDQATTLALTSLSMGDRTGSRVLQWVWPYACLADDVPHPLTPYFPQETRPTRGAPLCSECFVDGLGDTYLKTVSCRLSRYFRGKWSLIKLAVRNLPSIDKRPKSFSLQELKCPNGLSTLD
ncbi:hypothetical protein LZ30DRAFT_595084, partial [Colletotrichum cereale]